jgi:regulator of protease activity HflC (stomatin/prohibitin superfamily)
MVAVTIAIGSVVGLLLVLVLFVLLAAAKTVAQYERGVVLRLGRFIGIREPGLHFVIPLIDRMMKVDTRVVTIEVPVQEVVTRDNVSVKVDAAVYLRVANPDDAVLKVKDYLRATSLISQATLRSVLGRSLVDELIVHRDRINSELLKIVGEQTGPWGLEVSTVEIGDVGLPQPIRRAMATHAEVEQEGWAEVARTDADYQAAEKLFEAADMEAESKADFAAVHPIVEEWYAEDVLPYGILTSDISTLLELAGDGKVVLGKEFKDHTGLQSYVAGEVAKLGGDVWEARKQILQALMANSSEIESNFNILRTKLNFDEHALKAKRLGLIDMDEKAPLVERYLEELRTALEDGLDAIKFRDDARFTQINVPLWVEFLLFTPLVLTEDCDYLEYPVTIQWRRSWVNLHCDHDSVHSIVTSSEPRYQHYLAKAIELCPRCSRVVSVGKKLEIPPYYSKLFQAEKNKVSFAYLYAYELDDRMAECYSTATHVVLVYPNERELKQTRAYYSSEQNYQKTGILFAGQRAGIKLDNHVEYLSLKYKDNVLCLSAN